MENFVFCDGHAKAIQMVIANSTAYTKYSLYLPANQSLATDWCFDPDYTTDYYGNSANQASAYKSYPLPQATGISCSQAVRYVYDAPGYKIISN